MIPLTPTHLTCEYQAGPLGIDAVRPRLSWQLQSSVRGERQTAYRILAGPSPQSLTQDNGNLWDSGKVLTGNSIAVRYNGLPLASGLRCFWQVQVWDKDGRLSGDSPVGAWQMGLLHSSDWRAHWISAATPRGTKDGGLTLPPCPYLAKTFSLSKPVQHATLYATARGLYEASLNGKRLGTAFFAPGWTDYTKRIAYQTYDVTANLHRGQNSLGAILGDGWYGGYVGFGHQRGHYGDHPQFLAQMVIEYADGSQQTMGTDGSWRGTTGPIQHSDFLQGEAYDARLAPHNWHPVVLETSAPPLHQRNVTQQLRALVNDNTLAVIANNAIAGDPAYLTVKNLRVDYSLNGIGHTQTVKEDETLHIPGPGEPSGDLVIRHAVWGALGEKTGPPTLVAQQGPPVRVTQELKPRRMTQPAPGTYLYDLGQNMVGWARLKVAGRAGTAVRLRFGEILNRDGSLYTTNLRSARATDTYILKGGGLETWEPHFTFHGFRYIEVTGYPGKPGMDAVTGCVAGSDMTPSGTFVSSSPMVNKLQHNIVWGQRGNFLSVPTDCPQRDERLGWMGDAQIFARTATYNRDVAAFYEKWMQDVEDAQSSEGGFSDVSPRLVDGGDGAPAWGDAGIIVPWTVYQAYGDTGILDKHWAAMTRWLNYITSVNPDGLWINRRNNDFGDWLSIAADTPKDVLGTAYYAYDASLMARMARALGRKQEAARYDALFGRIKEAFNTAYVASDGRIKGDTQTCYVLALRFDLLPNALRPLAAQHLVDDIAAKNEHLSTGFVGVGYLCPVLTETGHNDTAYRLLLNDTFPSWGYSIKQGATTIWERWDGWTQEKGFQDPGMNSFNHYSLGSVGQWLFQDVAGIDTDPNQPGFAHILLNPHPGPGLSHVQAEYDSIRGKIASAWQTSPAGLTWNVTVPANTTATAFVPAPEGAVVTESGVPVAHAPGVMAVRRADEQVIVSLGSGTYRFRVSR
jgi:alpha-L-rhamnosidase